MRSVLCRVFSCLQFDIVRFARKQPGGRAKKNMSLTKIDHCANNVILEGFGVKQKYKLNGAMVYTKFFTPIKIECIPNTLVLHDSIYLLDHWRNINMQIKGTDCFVSFRRWRRNFGKTNLSVWVCSWTIQIWLRHGFVLFCFFLVFFTKNEVKTIHWEKHVETRDHTSAF